MNESRSPLITKQGRTTTPNPFLSFYFSSTLSLPLSQLQVLFEVSKWALLIPSFFPIHSVLYFYSSHPSSQSLNQSMEVKFEKWGGKSEEEMVDKGDKIPFPKKCRFIPLGAKERDIYLLPAHTFQWRKNCRRVIVHSHTLSLKYRSPFCIDRTGIKQDTETKILRRRGNIR